MACQLGLPYQIHSLLLLTPFAIVGFSKLACNVRLESWKAGALVSACWLWIAVSSLLVYPHSLAHANELAGGPGNPQAAYIHGNWDCGQDLLELHQWAVAHPEARPLSLAYYNMLDPEVVHFRPSWPSIDPGDTEALDPHYTQSVGPLPGYYALDLFHLSLKVYKYFQYIRPIARIGYSIFIYHITVDVADQVRKELGLPPLAHGRSLSDDAHAKRGFLHLVYKDARGRESKYVIFIPHNYRGDRAYPLILSLHGVGKAGTDGVWQLVDGLAPYIRHRQESFGFIAVFPQGPHGTWLPDADETKLVMNILAEVEKQYKVDPRRIFLTGISSGGTGTWTLAAKYPGRWAGIVPVSSGYSDVESADRFKDIPCWCFHNINDVTTSVAIPRKMIAAATRRGGRPRYTEFVALARVGLDNHNAWDKAYAMPLLYDWLQRQRLPEK
jgi:predicted esterase